MKNYFHAFTILFLWITTSLSAQQVPNSQFEDWSGGSFDGVAQPASWHYSNVTQFGYKFNFAHQESGHNGGNCIMMQDQSLTVAGIGETSPGYISLGQPWVYIEKLTKVDEATAGTSGGIAWTHRPDTMAVWIKRTGSNAMSEDFHLLYYSWEGTAYSDKYKGKNGNCTETSNTDEESDIRQSTDGNECGTVTAANQVAEGWYRQRAVYNNWTQIKVPIYYMNNAVPQKMNIIFSASNYPNFRANSGLYVGNSLYVDDVQLIYSSKIQQLFIGGVEWKNFDSHSSQVQYYVLDDNATTIPTIQAYRGIGQLTNSRNITTKFLGRQLKGNEISIVEGVIDQTPTTITVRAEDGSSTTTYQVLFMHKASNNAKLSGIQADGQDLKSFNPNISEYTVEVPYGCAVPVITVTTQEEGQTVTFTQPTSIQDVTVITVTAPDHTTTKTYTIRYKEGILSDNTLKGILVNGTAIVDFIPTKTNYVVNLPLGTTEIPIVSVLSHYPNGMQIVVLTPPDTIVDGSAYSISVTTPGNTTPMVYQLRFHLVQSSNCQLQAIFVEGEAITDFSPEKQHYQISLPQGTTSLPQVTYTPGDAYQTVEVSTNPITSITRIAVTAINGNRMIYTIHFLNAPTPKNILRTIHIAEIDSTIDLSLTSEQTFSINLPYSTTSCSVSYTKNYAEQTVLLQTGGISQPTILTVYPNTTDGQPAIYTIIPHVATVSATCLNDIKVDGTSLTNFSPNRFTYIVNRNNASTEPQVKVSTNSDVSIKKTTDLWHTSITIANATDTSTYQLYYHYPNEVIPNGEFTNWTTTKTSKSDKPAFWNVPGDYLGTYLGTAKASQSVQKENATIVHLNTVYWGALYGAVPPVMNLASMSAEFEVAGKTKVTPSNTIAFHNTPDRASINYKYPDIAGNGALFRFLFVDELGETHKIDHVQTKATNSYSEYNIDLHTNKQNITGMDIIVDGTKCYPNAPTGPLTDCSSDLYIDYIRFAYNNTLTSVFVNGKPATQSGNNFSIILPSSLDAGEPKLTFVGEVSDQAQMVAWQEPQIEDKYSVRKATIINYGEDGQSSEYNLTVRRPLDTNTTLKTIMIGGQSLADFNPNQVNYTYSLPYDAKTLPDVAVELQNDLQTCMASITSNSAIIKVQSEMGDVRTYTINFLFYPTLSMIAYNNNDLANFEEDQYNYVVQLKQDETMWPAVSYTKSDANLIVDATYIDSTATVSIRVTSPNDHSLYNTYTLTFLPYQSNCARLKDLKLGNQYSLQFFDTVFIYSHIELKTLQLPSIDYTLAEAKQTISMDTTYTYNTDSSYCSIAVIITVTAEDQYTIETYQLQFDYYNPNTYLKNILIKAHSLDTTLGFSHNFDSEQYDYYITYPIGSSPDIFYSDTCVTAIAASPNATVSISCDTIKTVADTIGRSIPVKTSIYIVVQNNNYNRTYTIHQTLLLDSLNRTTQLLIANPQGVLDTLIEFKPNEYYYVYTLSDTRNNVPDFTLAYSNTSSPFAYIGFERGNNYRIVDADDNTNYASDDSEDDPTYHLCYVAENGTKYVYKIKFQRTSIKRAQEPMEGDVLIQHIPGSTQIAIASLRANVVFVLYDMSGRMVKMVNLPEGNPNDFVTTTDGFGQVYFGHVTDISSCTILTLEPEVIYFWAFTENGKRKLKTGKLIIRP